MPGHLFIVRGDITKLACDAWLATGANGPGGGWRKQKAVGKLPQQEQHHGDSYRGEVLPWQRHESDDPDSPQPWFADVTGTPVQRTLEFLRRAAESLEVTEPRNKRVKPLLAIPLPGVGGAGFKKRAGEVVAELIPAVQQWLADDEVDVDVALVLRTDPHYFASQYVREQLDPPWPELHGKNLQRLKFLADQAKQRQLVIFLGAGVSIGAGLPDWKGFLDKLAEELGADQKLQDEIATLDVMDRPHALEAILAKQADGKHDSFKSLIKSTIEAYGSRYSLNHALLSVLPATEAVTTNYDQLFETACRGAGPDRERYRIPWDQPHGKRRWLLKMHGCVTEPSSIVLSRRDYSLYDAEHGILASIVQAMLVTRHMLFVGFGMSDPNFRSIFDTVKNALKQRELQDQRGDHDGAFGTALFLRCSSVFHEIWKEDVEVLDFGKPNVPPGDNSDLPQAARRTEIALDYLGAECCRDADFPLLDTRLFQSKVVSDDDLQRLEEIAGVLTQLRADCDKVKDDRVKSLLVSKVQTMIDELGG